MENLMLENGLLVQKKKLLPFDNAWEGVQWAKKEIFEYYYEMGHLSKKRKFYPLKMHEKAPGGQKSNFSNDY